ncbi:MAG: ROK family transcriptional regulator [Clostridia bacterium]|nr:ROK family transcriptional regulator [Clostridia bacterium]
MSKQVGNVALMQKMNRLRVLNFIRKNPDISRPVISEKTGLSLASITNITAYLLDAGFLVESGIEPADRVGRKSTLLRFGADRYGLAVATLDDGVADVFYTNLEGAVREHKRYIINDFSSEQVISLLREKINSLLDKYGKKNTLAMGITFSGLVLDGSRFVLSSSMKWKELDIRRVFEEDTGLPVFLENISMLRAVSYSSIHTEEQNTNTVFVDLQNGIGAVQLYSGQIVHTVLGEIGHTTVEQNGLMCFCGNRGCLEAMCSRARVLQLYNERSDNPAESVAEICTMYEKHDICAINAINECGTYLGIGLANLISLFRPGTLVINKGQFTDCEALLDVAVSEMKKRTYSALTQGLCVRMIDVAQSDMIRGAAFEICDRLFDISFSANPIR